MLKYFQVKRISKDNSGTCKFTKKETLSKTPMVAASDNTIFTTESIK